MAATIIIPDAPFRKQGFPVVTKSGGDIVKVDDLWISSQAQLSLLPDGNARWPEAPRVCLLDRVDTAIIENQLYEVKLAYEVPGYGGEANVKDKKVYSLRYTVAQVPIEWHIDYKFKWNHGLSADKHATFSTVVMLAGEQTKWEAAGRTSVPFDRIVGYKIPAGWEKKMLIYKDESDIPAGWVTDDNQLNYFASRTKRGVDFFEVCLYEVHEYTPYGVDQRAIDRMKAFVRTPVVAGVKYNNPHLEIPDETFGLPNTSGLWLCYGPEIDFTGKKYEMRRIFKHSPTPWDADLYKAW